MSSIADVFGGHANPYHAIAPVNQFQATSPAYGGTLDQANAQAAGGGGPASGTIERQNLLNDMLSAQATGQGPSVAQEQLRQTTAENVNRGAGAIASQRGVNPALAARMAGDVASGINQQATGQAATLRAGEMLAAREQLGGNLARTGGLQLGQQGAGTALLGTAGGLNLGAQGLNAQAAAQNAALNLGAQQISAGVAGQNAGINAGLVGGLINAGGAAMTAFSDERLKTDVHRGPGEAVPGVPQATFRYRGEPEGARHTGVIAQDLEKEHPELVGHAGGYRTVPAQPPFAYAAGGNVIPLEAVPTGGAMHSYLGALHGPAPVDPLAAAGSMDFANMGAPELPPVRPSSDPTVPSPETAAPPGAAAPRKAEDNPVQTFGKSLQEAGRSSLAAYDRFTSRPVLGAAFSQGGSIYAHGGPVPALVSPGEKVLPPGTTPGEAAREIHSARTIPGQANVAGDSPRNDRVRAELEPGSIVIPRSVVQSKNPARATSSFVASVLRRNGGQRRYAGGGRVATPLSGAKTAETVPSVDLSKGGFVEQARRHHSAGTGEDLPVKPAGKAQNSTPKSTARGAGRSETRRRMTVAKAPKYRET